MLINNQAHAVGHIQKDVALSTLAGAALETVDSFGYQHWPRSK